MRINSLELTDWRSHKKTKFKFGKVNLIRGINGVGKSSVAMALEYALTGRCQVTNEGGAGGERLIRTGSGAKEAKITLQIAVNSGLQVAVERTRTYKGGDLALASGDLSLRGILAAQYLAEKFGPKEVVSAAMRAGRFLALSKDQQGELLTAALKPAPVALPPEIAKLAQPYQMPAGPLGLAQLRELEKRSTEHRADCSAGLKAIGEPETLAPLPAGTPTVKECQAKLDRLRAEQNGLGREKAAAVELWERRQDKAVEAARIIRELGPAILTDQEEARYLAAIEDAGRAQTELDKIGFEIGQITAAEAKLAKAKEDVCPTCRQKINIEELGRLYEERRKALESRRPALTLTLEKYPPVPEANQALAAHRNAITEVDRANRTLAELPKDDLKPDTAGYDEKIAALEARIQKGQEVLAELSAFEEKLRANQGTLARRKALEASRSDADQVAKWAQTTAQTGMLADKIGAFVSTLNESLQQFGYRMEFSLDPYWVAVARFPIGTQLSLEQLSESEAYRFSVALQVALAKASGLDFIVLDRMDVLVGEDRSKVFAGLVAANLEQVFMLASVDQFRAMPPDVTVFDLTLNREEHTSQVEEAKK